MKRKTDGAVSPIVVPTKRFWLYLGLLVATTLLKRLLPSRTTILLLWFLLLLPLPLLGYGLAARWGLRVSAEPQEQTVQKGEPCSYILCIQNSTILLFPFIEAHISLPQKNAVRCCAQTVTLSLFPLALERVQDSVTFRYRGSYTIAVQKLYAYDLLRLFKVCVPAEAACTVSVLPRRPAAGRVIRHPVTDADIREDPALRGGERAEINDVRTYRIGDPLRSIHWPLSAKWDDLIVKEQQTEHTAEVLLLPDLAPHYPAAEPPDCPDALRLADPDYYDDMNEFLADGVVEMTIARALYELEAGRTVRILWHDSRVPGGPETLRLTDLRETDALLTRFGTAPLYADDHTVQELDRMIDLPLPTHRVYVLPTIEEATAVELCTRPGIEWGHIELLLYRPQERFDHPEELDSFLATCQHRIEALGGTLTMFDHSDVTPHPLSLSTEGGPSHVG